MHGLKHGLALAEAAATLLICAATMAAIIGWLPESWDAMLHWFRR